MLLDLLLVEQRLAAVREVVVDGLTVSEMARRCAVARQTVHVWFCKFTAAGMARLGGPVVKAARLPASDAGGGSGVGRGLSLGFSPSSDWLAQHPVSLVTVWRRSCGPPSHGYRPGREGFNTNSG